MSINVGMVAKGSDDTDHFLVGEAEFCPPGDMLRAP